MEKQGKWEASARLPKWAHFNQAGIKFPSALIFTLKRQHDNNLFFLSFPVKIEENNLLFCSLILISPALHYLQNPPLAQAISTLILCDEMGCYRFPLTQLM